MCFRDTSNVSAWNLTEIRSSKWKGIWPQIIKAIEVLLELPDNNISCWQELVAFTLKECRLRSAPGFDFGLEQSYCVPFRHHPSIFVPSMVALQLGTFRCKTALKGSSWQRVGKVFGNDTVSSHISILLQKVPLTDKRTRILTLQNLLISVTKIETNKMYRFEEGTSNCLQQICYVFLPIWTIIRELSAA